MSWTDKELSEMAKAAQAEQKFAYQDSFWSEMEAMLPAKKKKGLPFFWLALIPVVATFGYLVYPSTQASLTAQEAVKTMDGGMLNMLNSNQEILALQAQERLSENQQAHVAAKKQSTVSNQAYTTRVASTSENAFSKTNNFVSKKVKGLNDQISKTKPVSNNDRVLSIQMDKITTLKTAVVAAEDEPLEIISVVEEPIEVPSVPVIENKEKTITPWAIDGLKPLGISTFAFAANPELLPIIKRSRGSFWNGYVEAGFSMGQSYMISQVGHTSAFNLGAGVRRDYNNYFFQFGLAGELQKMKYELSDRSVIYGFDKTELENRFSYDQLYRVEAPLTIGYQFPKHTVQLSVIPAYLVGTKMDYSHLKNGSLVSNETMYEMEPGKKEAWNDFSTSFGVGYGYRLTRTITLGANVKWQLINQLNNKSATEGNVRPLSGQVFIRKTLK